MSDPQIQPRTAQITHLRGAAGSAAEDLLLQSRMDTTIQRATRNLIGMQYHKGYWWGELESNCAIQAEFLLLTHFMGVPDPAKWRKIVTYIKRRQLPDGGWPIWYGGPSDLSIAVECYFAMKLAGVDPNEPAMAKARAFILSKGGVPKTRIFTKMWLALFGQWEWSGTPVLPAEVMLLPNNSPFSIYEFASWARGTIVACIVLLNVKPVCPVPEPAKIDELYPLGREKTKYTFGKEESFLGWSSFFIAADKALRVWEASPVKPLRKKALDKAAAWIIERQETDGSWGGIQPPWVYSLMALKSLGYANDHPAIAKGMAGFDSFARETEDTFWTDACVSPVWDTCLAMLALQDAGVPATHPSLARATEWLLKEQVLHRKGDWAVKRPKLEPGGWAFEFENDVYPDIDDTAMVLVALHKMGWDKDPRMQLAIERGVQWLFGMQSKNGGWASFDVDNTKGFVREIPFCDFGEVLDPPTEDVTAHVLEILGRLGYRASNDKATKRGLDYLKATQKADGSWWGRWGVNYVYGQGAVLPALKWLGEDMRQPYIRKAVRWLEERQNPDGGWGETIESYAKPELAGRGPSTASQTGWALLALIAAGEARGAAAHRGVEYLAKTQLPNGSWDEPHYTGTGFPMDFMINYHLYRDYWPLMALGQYRQEVYGRKEHRDGRA